jgi:aryl-alcohol dehydrogenase-like predicted oxidoreductase
VGSRDQGCNRDEIVVGTRRIHTYDGAAQRRARPNEKVFIKARPRRGVRHRQRLHCMTPKYLLNQLDCKRNRLGSIDIYYLHNPETQLGKITKRI